MRFHLAIIAVIAALTALIYGQTATFDFVNYDDHRYVLYNPHIVDGLTMETAAWAFTTAYFGNWIPLTWLTYLLDVSLFGLNAGGFHVVNALWHALAGLLLYRFMLLCSANSRLSAFVAIVFIAHPMHVESVAWVSERKDVLSAAFGIAALCAYVGFTRERNARSYLLAILLFACSLMAKPMLVTLPVILLILDWAPLDRIQSRADIKRIVIEKIPFFALSVGSSLVTMIAQSQGGFVTSTSAIPMVWRILNAIYTYALYLGKFFIPHPLIPFYPHPVDTMELWKPLVGALVLFAITLLCWRMRKSRPEFAACWAIYLVLLLPVIGIIQVGSQSMADRYTYLPYIPVSIMVVLGAHHLFRWITGLRLPGILAAVCWGLALIGLATLQTSHWRNTESLFEHTLIHSPKNKPALMMLGQVYRKQDRLDESLEVLLRAVEVNAGDPESFNQVGQTLMAGGHLNEAETAFRKSIAADADYASAHNNLGNTLLQLRRIDEAVKSLERARELHPEGAEILSNLGGVYIILGRNDEAAEALKKSLELRPENAMALTNYAVTRMNDGDMAAALEFARRAVEVDPEYPQGQQLLRHLEEQESGQ